MYLHIFTIVITANSHMIVLIARLQHNLYLNNLHIYLLRGLRKY